MTRFLVTGANGFVGRVLCQNLIDKGHQVRASVRASATIPSGVEIFVVPVIGPDTDWSGALENVDVVVHLAARVHMMQDLVTDPLTEFMKVNTYGTLNLAQQAVKQGIKRFIYVSSIKVNGEFTPPDQSMTELDIPGPQDPYGISKWQAEQGLHKISQETGMGIVILRPPLIYGPNVKANFYSLLKLTDKSVPLPLGSITNSRSMIYVGNLVDALIQCATHPKAAGQTYLVSDGKEVSTPELVSLIADAMKMPSRIFHFPISLMRLGATLLGRTSMVNRLTQSLVVDSSKIRNDLSWTPPYTMSQGIQETANWYLHSKHSHHD